MITVLDSVFDVRNFGACGDGRTLDTAAIQTAIDACAAVGGVVFLPSGKYVSGTLLLRSHVTLHCAAGSVLLGSRDREDYLPGIREFRDAVGVDRGLGLILAHGEKNIAIEGTGTIDGRGEGWKDPRPMILRFIECRDVRVSGVTLKDSAAWVQHYLGCEDVFLTGVKVVSHCNGNNDGLNLDGCERVRVSDCHFSSGDDAFTLKCTTDRACRDIVVSNCLFQSDCNGIKLGTESVGGFENITITNCAVYNTRLCGLTIASVDGAFLRDVFVSNIVMRQVGGALFMRLGRRGYHLPDGERCLEGRMERIVVQGLTATGVDLHGSAILGLPENCIKDVTLENIFVRGQGGGIKPPGAFEEAPERYPQYDQWGHFPAAGLFCRCVDGLTMRNLNFRFERTDERPPLVLEKIGGLTQDQISTKS